ncbi:hybrid sensor histidine kinase/response regulator [Anaeromyxobacter paludicola]|uniref:histidine kinase n=1 Tax=Anaeromyxobacter paludicola TaxID=2918171 RepID=A0ABM7XBX6_9BACT|nr:response regulator [Anaeromyxobacter paludicola]BDG09363.1 hypothetical protein AMPC_24760 [Anaeromyxobacter paludicola]
MSRTLGERLGAAWRALTGPAEPDWRSHLERARAQLSAAERLAAVGKLAGGLAHEINNPLTFVLVNAAYAREELSRLEVPAATRARLAEVEAALREATEGAQRVADIVADLRAFGREQAGAGAGPVDLEMVLGHVQRLVSGELRARGAFTVSLAPGPLLVEGSAALLGEAFLTLLLQASAALGEEPPPGSEVRLSARREEGAVVVEVRDTGEPIPEEALADLFDPFAGGTAGIRQGSGGRGAGLGLAAARGAVEGCGGTIEVVPGARGALFRVRLRAATSESRLRLCKSAGGDGSGRPRVLVVDDEPLLCASVYRVLSPHFNVVPHTSARTALELLRQGERFDALLCDLMMPELSGMELFAEVSRLDPGLAAATVFLTGGAFTPGSRRFLERTPNPWLEKPFDPVELVTALREASGYREAVRVPRGSAK